MASFASRISDVLHQKTQLEETGDYQEARQRVSNFRYALIGEGKPSPRVATGETPRRNRKTAGKL